MRARDKAAGPTADIEADFGELGQLVSAIRTLADELSRNGSLIGQMDEPDLADALGRVERNWHKQRFTLQTFLDSAADSVRATLSAYRELESELAQAAAVGTD
jgi:methionine synthase II (cobalamin-independent)